MDYFFDELFKTAGIQRGDILEVASDLLSIMLRFQRRHEKFKPDDLLDALQRAVGEEGTVLIRAFSWDFCHGIPFNYKTTKSRVGALGNAALKRADFKRTKHPLYSWCVWGKEQAYLTEMDPPDAFGADSIFSILEERDAKLIRLGELQGNALTNMHPVEERVGIPTRFIKQFTGQYIHEDGSSEEKTYSMYVRDLNYRILETVEGFERVLDKKGVVARYEYDGIPLSVIGLKHFGEVFYRDIVDGKWGEWILCEKISQET